MPNAMPESSPMPPDDRRDRCVGDDTDDHAGVLMVFGVMALSGAVVGFLLGLWVAG